MRKNFLIKTWRNYWIIKPSLSFNFLFVKKIKKNIKNYIFNLVEAGLFQIILINNFLADETFKRWSSGGSLVNFFGGIHEAYCDQMEKTSKQSSFWSFSEKSFENLRKLLNLKASKAIESFKSFESFETSESSERFKSSKSSKLKRIESSLLAASYKT